MQCQGGNFRVVWQDPTGRSSFVVAFQFLFGIAQLRLVDYGYSYLGSHTEGSREDDRGNFRFAAARSPRARGAGRRHPADIGGTRATSRRRRDQARHAVQAAPGQLQGQGEAGGASRGVVGHPPRSGLQGSRRVIALETNILVYAHREDSPFHEAAFRRVAELAEGPAIWAIPWPCLHEFLAIVTHLRITRRRHRWPGPSTRWMPGWNPRR